MLVSKLIGVGIVVVGIAAGSALIMMRSAHKRQVNGPASAVSVIVAPTEAVHTADWYVAHPDILKADDAKCGGDAGSISPAACQNAATADQRLLSLQLQQAGAANASAGKNQTSKTP